MKRIMQTWLRTLSSAILKKYHPKIVAITGSIGKTSTKEAIFQVLQAKYHTRKSYGNYNNEIGVPLSIIGETSGEHSPLKWIWIFLKGLFVLIFHLHYPEILVLEMGADRPGDIAYLTSFVKPHVAVETGVGPSHLEFFKSIEAIYEEKADLVRNLVEDGIAVLNFDNEYSNKMSSLTKAKTLTFGFGQQADIWPSDIHYKLGGTNFKLNYRNNSVPVLLPASVGTPNLYASMAAAAVGVSMGMNLVEVSDSLKMFKGAPGRLRILSGVKKTILIDDTYNSAPRSALAALEAITKLPGKRKLAVLGDMAELGEFTEEGHRQAGIAAVDAGVDILITVGPKSKFTRDQAVHMGYPEDRIVSFDNSDEAKKPIEGMLEPDDIVLIKGSRAAHMEKIVKEIMAEPWREKELLVH